MHPGGIPLVIAEPLLQFGLLSYALLLPVVLYRLLFSVKLTDGEQPILVILATPASLLLLGYLLIAVQPNYLVLAVLLLLALVMTFFAYFAFFKLLRLPFTPAYSAFTFPLVVGAIALFRTRQFLFSEGVDSQLVQLTGLVANIELMIATLMVFYVIFRYLRYFSSINNPVN